MFDYLKLAMGLSVSVVGDVMISNICDLSLARIEDL
jgi:hypothetical protein